MKNDDLALKSMEAMHAMINECARRLKIYREALEDIENFHERDFEELEKRWGFLGWTCCGQKRHIAKEALAKGDGK